MLNLALPLASIVIFFLNYFFQGILSIRLLKLF